MKTKLAAMLFVYFLVVGVALVPRPALAQESGGDSVNGLHVVGSVLLSILHVPFKLATCVGTQVTAAVVYTGTYGVPGNYDGGTNGHDIGEVATGSCTGPWVVTPRQVKEDYRR